MSGGIGVEGNGGKVAGIKISRPGPDLPMDAWVDQRKSCAAQVDRSAAECTEVGFTLEQVHAMAHLFSAMIESHEANRGTK